MKSLSVTNLTRQLVAIPSFVDKNTDEVKVGNFIETFAKECLIDMPVIRQYIAPNSKRFNVYIGNPNPEMLVVGHFDTVQPQSGWNCDPFAGAIQNNRVYGLGASDMKGSIAAFLCALVKVKDKLNPNKLGIFLYCDEEYDFAGMKAYVKNTKSLSPKIIVSLDGNLQFSSGCRGLIEISGSTIGKSAHSSKPFAGINAISKTIEAFKLIDQVLSTFYDPLLGPTTTNLAYINGGSLQGNIIPAKADFIFEVRTSSSLITAKAIVKQLKSISKTLNVSFTNFKIRHDLIPWPPAYDSKYSENITGVLKECGLNPSPSSRFFSGYIDTAMLESIYPNVPKFVFGAGGENQHSPNEFVPIKNLETAQQIYEQLLMALAKK